MYLAWRDPALERTCSSSEALDLRWPRSADAVKHLLWIVKHSRDLAALLRHPSVAVALPGARRGGSPLSVRLRKTEMHAMALTRTGEVIDIAGTDQLASHASGTTALLVTDLTAEELGSLRKAI